MVDTSFKLISDFFHVNQGVLCCEHAEQASSSGVLEGGGGGGVTGLLNKGGGSNRLPVEFPQVQTSGTINSKPAWCISTEPCIHALIWQENRAINLKPEHFPCDCMASA